MSCKNTAFVQIENPSKKAILEFLKDPQMYLIHFLKVLLLLLGVALAIILYIRNGTQEISNYRLLTATNHRFVTTGYKEIMQAGTHLQIGSAELVECYRKKKDLRFTNTCHLK